MSRPTKPYTTLVCGNPTCRASIVMPTKLAAALTSGDTGLATGRQARSKLHGQGWRMATELGDDRPTPHCRRCSA